MSTEYWRELHWLRRRFLFRPSDRPSTLHSLSVAFQAPDVNVTKGTSDIVACPPDGRVHREFIGAGPRSSAFATRSRCCREGDSEWGPRPRQARTRSRVASAGGRRNSRGRGPPDGRSPLAGLKREKRQKPRTVLALGNTLSELNFRVYRDLYVGVQRVLGNLNAASGNPSRIRSSICRSPGSGQRYAADIASHGCVPCRLDHGPGACPCSGISRKAAPR